MILNNDALLKVEGGGLSISMLNAVSRLIVTVLDWGRAVGSTIYRYKSGNVCR